MTLEFYVLDGENYQAKYEHNMGNYNGSNSISTKMMLWNNRYGEDSAPTINEPTLYFYHKNVEDNNLLNFYSVKVDGDFVDFNIQNNKGVLALKRNLLGAPNNGDESNTKNFVTLEFIFNPQGNTLKNNDVKELYIEVR